MENNMKNNEIEQTSKITTYKQHQKQHIKITYKK